MCVSRRASAEVNHQATYRPTGKQPRGVCGTKLAFPIQSGYLSVVSGNDRRSAGPDRRDVVDAVRVSRETCCSASQAPKRCRNHQTFSPLLASHQASQRPADSSKQIPFPSEAASSVLRHGNNEVVSAFLPDVHSDFALPEPTSWQDTLRL